MLIHTIGVLCPLGELLVVFHRPGGYGSHYVVGVVICFIQSPPIRHCYTTIGSMTKSMFLYTVRVIRAPVALFCGITSAAFVVLHRPRAIMVLAVICLIQSSSV